MSKIKTILARTVIGVASLFNASVASASQYPDRPIKIVVPFSAGGQFDILARIFEQFASKEIGQTVIIENLGGAGGNIGAAKVAASEPDGYTLLALGGNHTISNALYAKPGFDIKTDFSPISLISISPHVLLINSAFPVKTFPELVEYSKSHPGALSYGTPGIGSSMHLVFEMIKRHYGLDAVHVPYRGGANALSDVAGGQIQLAFVTIAPALEFLKSGRIRPLAISSKERSTVLPETPSFAEIGYPELNTGSWMGLAGPKNLPAEIVARWNGIVQKFQADPVARKKLESLAFKMEPTTTEEFQRLILAETAAYAKVIKEQKITAN